MTGFVNYRIDPSKKVESLTCVEEQNAEFGWDLRSATELLNKYDLIVPIRYCFGKVNVFEQYEACFDSSPLTKTMEIILERHPEYTNALCRAFSSNKGYYCNMFLMPRKLFIDYMEFLFDILLELDVVLKRENLLPIINERIYAHISERIFSCYIEQIRLVKKYSIYESPMLIMGPNSAGSLFFNEFCECTSIPQGCTPKCKFIDRETRRVSVPRIITARLLGQSEIDGKDG